MEGYRELLREAFARYAGTLISGGTKEGISGLVGELSASRSGRDCTRSATCRRPCRPTSPRRGTSASSSSAAPTARAASLRDRAAAELDRSARVRHRAGERARARDQRRPHRGAGVPHRLGRSARRSRSSRAAGARRIGSRRTSRRRSFQGLLVVPKDPMTVQAFLQRGAEDGLLGAEQRERLARFVHARFLETKRHENPDVAMRALGTARPTASGTRNLDQMAYMAQILGARGLRRGAGDGPASRGGHPAADRVHGPHGTRPLESRAARQGLGDSARAIGGEGPVPTW